MPCNIVVLDRRDLWDHVRDAIYAALHDNIPKDCVVSWAWEEATNRTMGIFQKIVDTAPPAASGQKLTDIEQYRMQMAGISTAALGYWKEGDDVHPDYDTLALRDVAKLYAKYVAAMQKLAVIDDNLDFEPDARYTIADMANVGKSLMDYLSSMMPGYSWNETPAEVVSDLINQRDEAREDYDRISDRVVQWAVSRWQAEVANRPLINVHRRSLDDTWRQVIRQYGGDADALIGPSHDALLRASSATASDKEQQ